MSSPAPGRTPAASRASSGSSSPASRSRASALAAELAPEHLRGSYQGVLNLGWNAASGPALLVGLWLVGRGQGELMLALALPLGALGAVAFLALPARRGQAAADR